MCREHTNGGFTMQQAVMQKAARGGRGYKARVIHGFTVKEKSCKTSAYYSLINFSNEHDTSLPTTDIASSLVKIMACRLLELSYYPTQLLHIVNESLGTHITESWIKMQQFPCKKMRDYMNTKISPARCRPSCLGLGVSNKDVYWSLLNTAQPVIAKLSSPKPLCYSVVQ